MSDRTKDAILDFLWLIAPKLIGVAIIAFAFLAASIVSDGPTMADRDATGALFIGFFGVYLLFAK